MNYSLNCIALFDLMCIFFIGVAIYCNSTDFVKLVFKGFLGFNCAYFGLIMAIGLIP